MTVSSFGPRGEPIISDPPTTIADMTAIIGYAADVGRPDWIPYAPLFSNVANITAFGEYTRIGRQVFVNGVATFNSGGTVGGAIAMSLPFDRHGATLPHGLVLGEDSNRLHTLTPVLLDARTVVLYYQPAAAAGLALTSNSAPFNWESGNRILWDLSYAVD